MRDLFWNNYKFASHSNKLHLHYMYLSNKDNLCICNRGHIRTQNQHSETWLKMMKNSKHSDIFKKCSFRNLRWVLRPVKNKPHNNGLASPKNPTKLNRLNNDSTFLLSSQSSKYVYFPFNKKRNIYRLSRGGGVLLCLIFYICIHRGKRGAQGHVPNFWGTIIRLSSLWNPELPFSTSCQHTVQS